MTVALKLTKIGNSVGAILPKEALALLKVQLGDTLYLTETPGGFRVTPYEPGFEEEMEIADKAPGAEALMVVAGEEGRLHNCLSELDDRTETVIRTAFFEGVTYDALARRMDTPLGTVKSWVRRGLAKLKGCLEQ